MHKLKIITKGLSAMVYAPYHPDFPDKMRSLHAVWDRPNNCWWVSAKNVGIVREYMRVVFGTDDTACEEILSVKVTFSESDGAFRKDYILFGKVLSHATSMTSGAVSGEDVCYIQGAPESGGSSKNWCSVVPRGSVIRVDNVTRNIIENQTIPSAVSMEVLTEEEYPERAKLIQERRDLMKRIEQIDLLLNMK